MPLEDSHRGVACVRCHEKKRGAKQRFRYPSTDCGSCHEDVHEGQFLVQGKAGQPIRECASCHSTLQFAPVYVEHWKTGFPLTGLHEQTACASCHKKDKAGHTRYRDLDRACASCHTDAQHQGQFRLRGAARDCSDCHNASSFEIKKFDHAANTKEALAGAHKKVKCKKCHEQVRLNNGRRVALYRLGSQDCSECHALQHKERKSALNPSASAALLDTALGSVLGVSGASHQKEVKLDDCKVCHSESSWQTLQAVAGFDHTRVGYALRGQHAAVACEQCHSTKRALKKDCVSCHQDRHRGRMGVRCAECHQESSWRATDIRDRHRQTRLPLTGRHALTDCTSCHPRDRQGQYIAVPVACIGCHASDYTAPATHPNHPNNGFGTQCEQCHRPYGWSPAYFVHTTFVLEGAHRSLSCRECHDQDPTPRLCVGCHNENRQDATVPDHRVASFPTDCESCHSQRAWLPATFSEHEQFFPIARGKHGGLECSECHQNATDTRSFTCTTSCHPRSKMDRKHDEEFGYVYESRACLMCHPRGDKE